MGKRPVGEHRDGHDHRSRDDRYQRQKGHHRVGGDHGQRQWLPTQGRRRGQHRTGRSEMEEKAHDREEGQVSDVIRSEKAVHGDSQVVHGEGSSGPKARKALFQSNRHENGGDQQGGEERDSSVLVLTIPSHVTERLVADQMDEKERFEPRVGDDLGDKENLAEMEGEADTVMEETMQEDNSSKGLEDNIVETEVPEGDMEQPERGEEEKVVRPPARKKVGKGIQVLQAVSSKKRLVQTLLSPRKRGGNKGTVQFGDGLYPAKPRKELGNKGDHPPPKPDN